jgi:acetyl esterase/lipase
LWPPARSGLLGLLTWLVSAIPNESPFLALYWLGASTLLALSQGEFHGAWVWAAVGIAAASFAGAPVLIRRSLRAAPAIEQALEDAIGPRWRLAGAARSIATHPPWGRILFATLPVLHPGVTRISNLSYGDAGRRNRLDLYRRRGGGSGGPVLIELHGGGFSFAPGRKSFYARRLTSAKTARALADQARSASANPVVYVELPAAQHSFDLLTSIRFEAVIDGIEAFAAAIAAPDLTRADRADQLAPETGRPSAAPWRGHSEVRSSHSARDRRRTTPRPVELDRAP